MIAPKNERMLGGIAYFSIKKTMNKYYKFRIIVGVIIGATILGFTGCGGSGEAEASASVNKTPVATSNENKVT